MTPLVGCLEPGDHQQRRGLAGAARAEEGDEFAARNVDRDIVDGIGLAVVRFDDVAQAKIGHASSLALAGSRDDQGIDDDAAAALRAAP